jgi:hypothetical protein
MTCFAQELRKTITFNENGGWCWFQDERVLIHNGRIIMGSVSCAPKGQPKNGDVDLTIHDIATGKNQVVTLHEKFAQDDHNAPALLVRQDGRYLATYSRHGGDSFVYYRISKPSDPLHWDEEQKVDVGARTTYNNLYRLPVENNGQGRLYDFHRGVGYNPNYLVSDDDGSTWRYGGRVLQAPKARPYMRYVSNGRDKIHFIATEGHPGEFPAGTSVRHGFIQGGNVCQSDGSLIGPLSTNNTTSITLSNLTTIFKGNPENKAWISSIRLDTEGLPRIAYSVHKSDEDLRYRYARWDGKQWHDQEIAFAGTRLYEREKYYTGLITLVPTDLNIVYISSNADPKTGKPLISTADQKRHYEIFRGTTSDGGATWTWRNITSNSTCDNLRPIIPPADGKHQAMLWLQGTYTTYLEYNLKIVGLVGNSL